MRTSHVFKYASLLLTFPYMLFAGVLSLASGWDLGGGRHRQLGTRGRGEESGLAG